MATGTGLPTISGGGPVAAEAPRGPSGDSLFNAASWEKIANAGEEVRNGALGYVKLVEHQAHVGSLAERDVGIERRKIEFRDKFPNDPAGFDNAWQAYSEGVLATAEPWAVNHVKSKLGHAGNEAFSAITSERRHQVQASAQVSWNALVDQTSNRLMGMAMAGQLDTPEGQAEVLKFNNVVRSGVTSNFIPPEEAERRVGNMFDTARVYNAKGDVESAYKKNNSPIEAMERVREITRNPEFKLSPEQRFSLEHRLGADVHAMDAARTRNLSAVNLESQQLLHAIGTGLKIPESRIQETLDRFKQFGGQAEAADFLAKKINAERTSFISALPTADAADLLRQYHVNAGFGDPVLNRTIDAAASMAGVDPSLMRRIAKIESSGNPGAVMGSNKGLFQMSDAEFAKYGGGNILNPVDNANAAARKTAAEIAQFRASYGREPTPTEIYLQHQQGVAGLAAHMAQPTAPAWQNMASTGEGKKKGEGWAKQAIWGNIPDAIKAQFPGGVNSVTSADFMRLWQGKVQGGGGAAAVAEAGASGNDIAFLAQARTVVEKKVVEDAQDMITKMDNGILPTQDSFNKLLSTATVTNSPGVLQAVAVAGRKYQAHRQFGRAPTDEAAGILNEMQQQAKINGLNPQDGDFLTEATKALQRTDKALTEDPLSQGYSALAETAGIPVPGPLNMSNPAAFRAGLAERAQWAALTTTNYKRENTPVPALTKAEFAQVNAAYNAASTDNKIKMLGDIAATLPPDTYRATMDQIGDKGVTTFVARLAQERPQLAYEILRGQDKLNLEKTGDRAKDVRAAFQNKFGAELYPSAGDQNAVTSAAMAVYAARRPDPYDATDSAAIEKAIDDVAGKITKRNGMKVAVPPGLTEAAFTGALSRVSDADLSGFGGAFNSNGTPMTAKFIRDNAVLRQMMPGGTQYMLGVRDATARDGFRPIMRSDAYPLVIDVPQMAAEQTKRGPATTPNKPAFFGQTAISLPGNTARSEP